MINSNITALEIRFKDADSYEYTGRQLTAPAGTDPEDLFTQAYDAGWQSFHGFQIIGQRSRLGALYTDGHIEFVICGCEFATQAVLDTGDYIPVLETLTSAELRAEVGKYFA